MREDKEWRREESVEARRRKSTRGSAKAPGAEVDDVAIPDYVMLDFGLPNVRRRALKTPDEYDQVDLPRGRE